MNRTTLAPPVMEGALDELRQWLAVTRDSESPQLESLLRASLDACEAFTGIVPISVEAEAILPVIKDWQGITAQPVQAVLGIEGIPAEGPRIALASDAWAVELGADGTACIRIVRPGAAGRVAVRFIAGLAPNWATLPDGLRHGILRLAAHHYRAREDDAGGSPPRRRRSSVAAMARDAPDMIDARIRPPAAAMTRRLAARAARLAVEAIQARRNSPIARDPRGLWPDMFEE